MVVHSALVMGIYIYIYLYVCNGSAHAQTCTHSSRYENGFARHLQIRISMIVLSVKIVTELVKCNQP